MQHTYLVFSRRLSANNGAWYFTRNICISKGIFIGKTGAEAETPILRHLMGTADSLEKTLMLGRLKAKGEGGSRG